MLAPNLNYLNFCLSNLPKKMLPFPFFYHECNIDCTSSKYASCVVENLFLAGGYFHQNFTWLCVPNLKNLTLTNYPLNGIPVSIERHSILPKLDSFCNNLLKIHPIFSSLIITHRSLYQISRKSTPKGRHIYVYQVNVRPPGVWKLYVTV